MTPDKIYSFISFIASRLQIHQFVISLIWYLIDWCPRCNFEAVWIFQSYGFWVFWFIVHFWNSHVMCDLRTMIFKTILHLDPNSEKIQTFLKNWCLAKLLDFINKTQANEEISHRPSQACCTGFSKITWNCIQYKYLKYLLSVLALLWAA